MRRFTVLSLGTANYVVPWFLAEESTKIFESRMFLHPCWIFYTKRDRIGVGNNNSMFITRNLIYCIVQIGLLGYYQDFAKVYVPVRFV